MPADPRSFAVCVVAGIVEPGDAISETVLASVEAIGRIRELGGRRVEVRVYCLASSAPDPRIVVLADWRDLLADPFFQTADMVIHHIGVFSDIHHAMAFAPRRCRLIATWYGFTPPQYLPPADEALIHRSYQQLALLELADDVVVTSRYLAAELARMRLPRPPTVMPLFGRNAAAGGDRPVRAGGPVRLIYCGRLVRSKWVRELVEALAALPQAAVLTVVAMSEFSDSAYADEVRAAAAALPGHVRVELRRDLRSADVAAAIAAADLLVLPSRHEGFGMPVAEALIARTPVLVSDAGALPELAPPELALSFAAGDREALATALAKAVAARAGGRVATGAGVFSEADWSARAALHASSFLREAFLERWEAFIRACAAELDPASGDLAAAVRTAHAAVHGSRKRPTAGDRLDAVVIGRFLGAKASWLDGYDRAAAIDTLREWGADAAPECHDSAPERDDGGEGGLLAFARRIVASPELRASPRRSALTGGVLASLAVPPAEDAAGDAPLPVDRDAVVAALSLLREPRDVVAEAYKLLLGRSADPPGFDGFVAALQAGTLTRRGLVDIMMESPEMRSRALSWVRR